MASLSGLIAMFSDSAYDRLREAEQRVGYARPSLQSPVRTEDLRRIDYVAGFVVAFLFIGTIVFLNTVDDVPGFFRTIWLGLPEVVRTAIVAPLLTLVLVGASFGLFQLREHVRHVYGWIELAVGSVALLVAVVQFQSFTHVIAILGCCYGLVRGFDNIKEGIKKRTIKSEVAAVISAVRDQGGVNLTSIEEARVSAIDKPEWLRSLTDALNDPTRRVPALELILVGRPADELKSIADQWKPEPTPPAPTV
jgi:hypothetical protein